MYALSDIADAWNRTVAMIKYHELYSEKDSIEVVNSSYTPLESGKALSPNLFVSSHFLPIGCSHASPLFPVRMLPDGDRSSGEYLTVIWLPNGLCYVTNLCFACLRHNLVYFSFSQDSLILVGRSGR